LILVQQGLEPQYSKSPSEIDSLESSPAIISDQTHIVPFLGVYADQKKQQQQQQNNNQSYHQEYKHNVAAAVGIETDV
jgi:hypothetical protein